MPAHCQWFSCSPKMMIAPISVHNGPVERMGVTIDIGRCLIAKNEKIHDPTTIMDLMKIINWTLAPLNGINRPMSFIISGLVADNMMKGAKQMPAVKEEMNNTGITALFETESFLKMS